jgi:hypothetical protein
MPAKFPVEAGEKVTAWCTTSPGASTRPSLIGAGTRNGAAGGAALVRVSGMFPVLAMSKLSVFDSPTERSV